MSFLNPVNEPVLRFKSTDVGAPQINYATRVAGDVKTVLKACLVTGYGATASAGWTAVNEVANVIEFVSPSAAMSDYRLSVDDTSASSTVWSYFYQDVRVTHTNNTPTKNFSNSTNTHASNSWQVLVTDRGLILIELVQHSSVNKLSARITYWGQVKSALNATTGKNICFFNLGHNATISSPNNFYSSPSWVHINLASNTSAYISAATTNPLFSSAYVLDTSNVDLVSPIYFASASQDLLIGELPSMLSKIVNNTADIYGVNESLLGSRNVLSVCAGRQATLPSALTQSRTFLIPTDYWEY